MSTDDEIDSCDSEYNNDSEVEMWECFDDDSEVAMEMLQYGEDQAGYSSIEAISLFSNLIWINTLFPLYH